MNKSKIEWCDATWNPVTGCLHGCEYCYARKIAERFRDDTANALLLRGQDGEYGPCRVSQDGYPFPAGFNPTLYPHRLDEPKRTKKPLNIFVCSMADLFGEWVPDAWIKAAFEACLGAPQHRYLFLTKNPKRYGILSAHCKLPRSDNFFFGTTITGQQDAHAISGQPFRHKRFLSIEPIFENICSSVIADYDWVIVGAESGNRRGKVVPKREWIVDIVEQCRVNGIPVFMKNSLAGIWGAPLIQELPWA